MAGKKPVEKIKYTQAEDFPPPPYVGWSPMPGEIRGVPEPRMQRALCPCLPESCGSIAQSKCVVPAQQPVVPIPIYQEIQKRDRIVEVPQMIIKDKIFPKIYNQEVFYEVPRLNVRLHTKTIDLPKVEFTEKLIDVPVPVGYNYKVVSKWEIREVPKIIPKYVGTQEEIFIEVPQVKIVDKTIEKEVPVYVGEKIVKTEVIEEEPVEVVQYRYVEKEEVVPIYRYKPVFDVQVDIPPPLLVPVPVEPKKIHLEPERITLEEWKRNRMGGFTSLCDEYGPCGPTPSYPCCMCAGKGTCVVCCHPGGFFSRGGICGALAAGDIRDVCAQCQGMGCCKCCDPYGTSKVLKEAPRDLPPEEMVEIRYEHG